MRDELTKAQVLARLGIERCRGDALLGEVGDDRMTAPILASWWAINDILVHITWHKQQTSVLHPAAGAGAGRGWRREVSADQRNTILLKEHRDRPLAEVQTEARQVVEHLVATRKLRPGWRRWPRRPPPGGAG